MRTLPKLKLLLAITATLFGGVADAGVVYSNPTVHFTLYNLNGTVRANGDEGTGNSWVNNTQLVDSQHKTGYMANFWIDSQSDISDISWTINWSLAFGGVITSSAYTAVSSYSDISKISIGTSHTGWGKVSGTILGTATEGVSSSAFSFLNPGQSINLGSATSSGNQSSGSINWDGGTTGYSFWAYVSAVNSVVGAGNLSASFTNYGTLFAVATVSKVVADPIIPDAGPNDGGLIGDQDTGPFQPVPEPSQLMLCLAGILLLTGLRHNNVRANLLQSPHQ